MKRRRPQQSPLLYEQDGDFNPGWLVFCAFATIGAGVALGSFFIALVNPEAWPLGVAALSFIVAVLLITAIMVVPIARAKLLSKGLPAAVQGIGGGNQLTVDNLWTDNETSDTQPVRDYHAS